MAKKEQKFQTNAERLQAEADEILFGASVGKQKQIEETPEPEPEANPIGTGYRLGPNGTIEPDTPIN